MFIIDDITIENSVTLQGGAVGTPVTLTPDLANAQGSATSISRSDHVHTIATAAATGLNANSTNTQGVSTSFSRADHTHAIASGTPSTQNADVANATGTSVNFARADHIHNIPTAIVVDIGGANAQGVSTSFAKADHVHRGLRSINANGGTQRFNDVTLQQGTGVTVVDNGSGIFTIDSAFGQNEFFVTNGGGLTANYTGGRYNSGLNGTITSVVGGSVAVPANTTGFIYLNNLTGVVVASATAPAISQTPMAQFVSGPSTITSLVDARTVLNTVLINSSLRMIIPTSGLNVSYNSGVVNINGNVLSVAAGTIALTPSIANGIVYINSAGVITNSSGAFPPNCVPMYTYVTGASTVTTLASQRSFVNANVVTGLVADIVTIVPNALGSAGSTGRFADAGHTHAIVAAAAVSISTTSTNGAGVSTSFARADHTHAVSVDSQQVTATADTTTTSATDVLIAGMTLTPAAGTYLVMFSTSVETSSDDASVFVNIYMGGTLQGHTERQATNATSLGSSANTCFPVSTQAILSPNGSQAIEGRWRRTAGTATAHERTLTILRIA